MRNPIFTKQPNGAYWTASPEDLLSILHTSKEGLSEDEILQRSRLRRARPRRENTTRAALLLLLTQFTSPIILILIFAAALSFFLHDSVDAVIIMVIVAASGFLGFWQEWSAQNAVGKLLALVQVRAKVLRAGKEQEIPSGEVLPGDILLVSAGSALPGDALILESQDLFVDEASLTGETYPVEKSPGRLPENTPLQQRTNSLFMGTHVVSGFARALVVHTGEETEFGRISSRLKLRPPETEFEHGVRRFGYFLAEVTFLMLAGIFAVNIYFHHPFFDALLFSLALAVGLTPQLLPAIISINLSHGARRMARQKVIVKRLNSIENFGSMDILCSDKTGTLTEGVIRLEAFVDPAGKPNEKVLFYAFLNASMESGFANPIDEAVRQYKPFGIADYRKLDEIPYDFNRKRLSVLVECQQKRILITKGALQEILAVSARVEKADGSILDIGEARSDLQKLYENYSRQGLRTLGVAYREMPEFNAVTKQDEQNMTFLGMLIFADPLKSGIGDTIAELQRIGVGIKIITGDNRLVSAALGKKIGFDSLEIVTGPELNQWSDEALVRRVANVHVFAEVEPNQKERIILALRKAGHVVGYMGDGINDASALHAADVGLSVDDAVDVAKEAADIVLLEKDMSVLLQGIREGRVTFANTLKYVFMATSANFGNMFSMAGASLFLPFLPLLPKQILFLNLLTDIPEMAIANDHVDPEAVDRPRRWDIRFIRKFMIVFGTISSFFDYLTFGVLLWLFQASPGQFRTGWFIESVVSAVLIVLVIRTRRPFYTSRPGHQLFRFTMGAALAAIILPYTPMARWFGFESLSWIFILVLGAIVGLYIGMAESAKKYFYRRVSY